MTTLLFGFIFGTIIQIPLISILHAEKNIIDTNNTIKPILAPLRKHTKPTIATTGQVLLPPKYKIHTFKDILFNEDRFVDYVGGNWGDRYLATILVRACRKTKQPVRCVAWGNAICLSESHAGKTSDAFCGVINTRHLTYEEQILDRVRRYNDYKWYVRQDVNVWIAQRYCYGDCEDWKRNVDKMLVLFENKF